MSTNPLLHEDAAARLRALEPRSFIVEAPAGAGKTELLTQRTLKLLTLVDNPEEVVALTFTNKAAAEMRDRILGSLEMAASGVRPGDDAPHRQLTFDLGKAALAQDAERGWGILAHPGRLKVTTLDALCGSLARQMPLLSRFGAQPAVSDDADTHYRTAARRTLAMVEEAGPAGDTVAAALAFLDNDSGRLETLLADMLASRDQWLPHTGRAGDLREEAQAGLAALVLRDLEAAAAALPRRVQELFMAPARFAAANLAAENPEAAIIPLEFWTAPLTADPGHLPQWRALAALLLTTTGTLRQKVDKRQGFPATPEGKPVKEAFTAALAELGGEAERALASIPGLPDPAYDDGEWETVETFSRLLNLATAQLWLAFQEAGEVDFIEIAQRAVTALGDDEAPTDLALALDYRLKHLLVDEFQDTSPGQVRLVAGLTRGWQAGDGRSLFLVGDPMQSIYRFRKADVGLFLKVRDDGIGGIVPERLKLYRNNRSRPAVVEWVNRAFPAIFPAVDDPLAGAVRYAPAAATRDTDASAGVFTHPLLIDDDTLDPEGLEARCLVDLIRATRRERPEDSIAVLVRARRHLDALVAEIRRAAPDLPFQAVETESLAGRQAVADLISLTRALGHRGDRVHWLAVLRAPWCGLTLADLHALAADSPDTVWQLMQDEARLDSLTPDGRQRLLRLRAIFAEAFAALGRQHPRRWIEGVWHLLGGPACLGPDDGAATDALFALMDRLAAARHFDPDTLESEAAALFAPADPDPLASRLQMMTIHKSKGLEFDTVLLPGLHREGAADAQKLLLWDEIPGPGAEEWLVAAPLKRRGGNGLPTAYDLLRRLETERAGHETERLLYVAATRARRALHLVGTAKAGEAGLKPPPAGTLLALLWPAGAGAAFAAAEAAPADKTAAIDPTAFIPDLLRLPASALRPLPPLPAAALPPSPAPQASAPGAALDAAVGTLVHRCLEIIAAEGPEPWPAERITAREPSYAAWLRATGLPAKEADAGARRAVAALTAALASDAGRWLLTPHPGGGAEIALSSAEGEAVAHHVVDRSFIADGCRWIVDYKTVRLDAADTRALHAKAESYRPQLERYASLFAKEGLPQRLAIFFVAQGRLTELSPSPAEKTGE